MRVPASTLSLTLRDTRFDAAGDLLGFRFSRLNAFGFDRIDHRLELCFHSWIPRIENGWSSPQERVNSGQKRILYRESYAPPAPSLFIWKNGRAETAKVATPGVASILFTGRNR